ncbi:MAG: MATE family efflux transporter [Lachnospiraceae bacterium]|nr:MATE family efflux transporter [Lachnospiraceae bacterium]
MENKGTKLLEGSIWKGIVSFAIPMFLGNLFQQLYNTVDSLIVGKFLGSEALAAVTSSGSLIFLMVGFFNGIAMGAGVVISKYFGAKDYDNLKKAVHTDVAFGLVAGGLLTIIGLILAPQMLIWMGTPADVLPNSIAYFRTYFMGSIAFVMYNIVMGILQATGDSKHPLYYLILSSIINVILDLLFVGVFKWGVASAALATAISQATSAILCFIRLVRTKDVYQVHIREIRFHFDMLKQIIRIGLPTGMQNSIIAIANVVVQSNINAFGMLAVAGSGVYSKIEGFVFLPITCFSMSLTTFIGQNLGAKQFDRAKKGARFGVICSITLAELVGVLVYALMPILATFFDSNPEVVAIATLQARTESLFYFLLAFSHCISGILRGAGKSAVPMYVMLIAWCAIRITYITIAVQIVPVVQTIYWAYPLTWSISSIIFLIYYLKVDWVHGFEK